MPLHNGPNGYGTVTKTLHWVTLLAPSAQFTVGYSMDVDDSGRGRGSGRSGGDSDGGVTDRGAAGGGDATCSPTGATCCTVHVALGLLILTLAVVRVTWRRIDGLPPWAEALSQGQRRLARWTEKALLVLLFVIPATGLALVLRRRRPAAPPHRGPHHVLRGSRRPSRARAPTADPAEDAGLTNAGR